MTAAAGAVRPLQWLRPFRHLYSVRPATALCARSGARPATRIGSRGAARTGERHRAPPRGIIYRHAARPVDMTPPSQPSTSPARTLNTLAPSSPICSAQVPGGLLSSVLFRGAAGFESGWSAAPTRRCTVSTTGVVRRPPFGSCSSALFDASGATAFRTVLNSRSPPERGRRSSGIVPPASASLRIPERAAATRRQDHAIVFAPQAALDGRFLWVVSRPGGAPVGRKAACARDHACPVRTTADG